MSCPYANLLGEPNKGVHSIRLFGFSLVDTLLTVLVAFITTYFTGLPFFISFADWFFLGETLHYFFCVKSSFMKLFD